MAAEMCSGMLAFGQVYKRNPKISMLVIKLEVNFVKKATGTILFTCEDGAAIQAAINDLLPLVKEKQSQRFLKEKTPRRNRCGVFDYLEL